MSDETTTTVQLGGESITLQRPGDMFARMEIWELGLESLPRARGAALGYCWQGLKRPRATLRQHGYNLAEYGEAVITELLERGYSKLQIMTAGNAAYVLCTRGLITQADVEAAAGNSDGEEGSPG